MSTQSLYDVLQVDPTASKEDIRKAYRRLQMRYHPDKNGNSPDCIDMTKRLNQAYEVLGDDERRRMYNLTLKKPEPPVSSAAATVAGTAPLVPTEDPLRKPVPIFLPLHVTFAQMYHGASVPIEVHRWSMETGTKTAEQETIYVQVPAGIDDGEMLILRERGNVLHDALKGDVKLSVKVEPHPLFVRKGLDLILRRTLTLKEALCGFLLEIPHPNGKTYTVRNQPGTVVQPGQTKEFPDMGLRRDQHVGKLVVEFSVQFPESLTAAQLQSLQQVL